MKSSQPLLLAALAFVTIGASFIAWRQHAELSELRGAALAKDERADLQKRLWHLEKTNRELSDQLAAQRAGGRDPDGPPPADGPARGARGGFNPNNPREAAMRDLLARPEVQAMFAAQQKQQIEQRYAALFRLLNLSPEQAERLKTLLAERQSAPQEVLTVAREQGIDPRSDRAAFQKLLTDARDAVDTSIKGLLGDGGFAQLQTYEHTMPQRAIVDQLQQRLSYTPDPLSSAQAEQLVGILAANSPPATGAANPNRAAGVARGGPGDSAIVAMRGGPDIGAIAGAFLGGGGAMPLIEAGLRGPGAPITPAAVNQAQGVLSPPQLSALQQIQQQQQQTQQVRQLFNETMTANPSGAKGGPPPPPSDRRPGG